MEIKDIREKAIDLLNECLKTDKISISNLINERISVSKALADHPTIQVQDMGGNYILGMLGILNGILSKNNEFIVAVYESNQNSTIINKFEIRKI